MRQIISECCCQISVRSWPNLTWVRPQRHISLLDFIEVVSIFISAMNLLFFTLNIAWSPISHLKSQKLLLAPVGMTSEIWDSRPKQMPDPHVLPAWHTILHWIRHGEEKCDMSAEIERHGCCSWGTVHGSLQVWSNINHSHHTRSPGLNGN